MTPQQRKLLITLLSDFSDDVPSNGFESDERAAFDAALAMLTDEADLRRRIGEAVIANLPRHVLGDAHERPSSIINGAGIDLEYRFPSGWSGPMLRAIARVLREAGR